MTTQQRLDYIRSFFSLVTKADTYRDAIVQAAFVRGLLAMCFRDQSISIEDYRQFCQDLETMMEVKRNIPTIPTIPEKELF